MCSVWYGRISLTRWNRKMIQGTHWLERALKLELTCLRNVIQNCFFNCWTFSWKSRTHLCPQNSAYNTQVLGIWLDVAKTFLPSFELFSVGFFTKQVSSFTVRLLKAQSYGSPSTQPPCSFAPLKQVQSGGRNLHAKKCDTPSIDLSYGDATFSLQQSKTKICIPLKEIMGFPYV